MNHQSFFADIRTLIARDELPAALEKMRGLLEHSPRLDEVLHQSGRFENIRTQIRLGLIGREQADVARNRVSAALLELVSEVETQGRLAHLGAEIDRAVSVLSSKNVVAGSTITAGGNITIGDQTTVTESRTSRRLRFSLYFFVPLSALAIVYLWYARQPVALTIVAEQIMPIPELPFEKGRGILPPERKADVDAARALLKR